MKKVMGVKGKFRKSLMLVICINVLLLLSACGAHFETYSQQKPQWYSYAENQDYHDCRHRR